MTIRWQEPQVCTGEAMSPAGGHLLAWEHLQFSSLTKEGSLAGRSGYLQFGLQASGEGTGEPGVPALFLNWGAAPSRSGDGKLA